MMLKTMGWVLPELIEFAEEQMSQRPHLAQIEEAMAEIKQARSIEDAATLPIKEIEKRRLAISDAARRILLAKIADLEDDIELIAEVRAKVNQIVIDRRNELEAAREDVRQKIKTLSLSKNDETFTVENSEPVVIKRQQWEQARLVIGAITGGSNSDQDPHHLQRLIEGLRKELATFVKKLLGPVPETLSIDEKVELGVLHTKPKQIVRNASGERIDAHTGKAPMTVFVAPDEE